MVSPEHNYVFRGCHFHEHEQTHDFNGHNASIDIIAQENKSGLLPDSIGLLDIDISLAADFFFRKKCEDLDKIKKLSMNIANNDDRIIDLDNIRLLFYTK